MSYSDGAMLTKSLIQFSVEGWGCVLSLLFDLRPNYGRGNEDIGDLLQKAPRMHSYTQCPQPCSRLLLTHSSSGESWTLMGKFDQSLVGSLLLSPGFWCTQGSVCALTEPVSPVLCKFWLLYGGLMLTSSKSAYAIPRSTALRAPPPTAVHC